MGNRKHRRGLQPAHEPDRDHESLILDWQQHAEQNDERNFEFVHSLKRQNYGFDADEIASALHEQAFQILDCTQCANCCKTMEVTLEQSDVDRLAQHLKMTPVEFVREHLELSDDGYLMRQRPCPMLGKDNRCTVYDVRPAACREFPHTNKDGFASRSYGHSANAKNCPAVFWIIERMRQRAEE